LPKRFISNANKESSVFYTEQPKIIEAAIFTRLPEQYRRKNVRTAWADANRGGAPTEAVLEGPVFDRHGNLYVTDIIYGRIFRIDPNGNWDLIAEYDGEPNGMKFANEKTLVIADYKKGIVALNIETGVVTPYLDRRNTESFKGVNDLFFDSRGNLYFTDQGQTGMHDPTGRVYRLSPEKRLDLLLSNVPSPNGIVLSPDEKVLFVACTRGNCIWRGPLQADGSVSKVGQFFTSHGPSGPDGLAVDANGRLIIANPGLGQVWVINHRGEPEHIVRSPVGPTITNVAYGGPERKTLFITESFTSTILRAKLDVAGAPIPIPDFSF
jgi:gluconolactonase